MRIDFVVKGSLQEWRNTMMVGEEGLLLMSFDTLDEVSYERELKGQSVCFEEIAMLSKRLKNVVVCGCETDMRGLKRKSAIVAENVKILGISDMLHAVDGKENRGSALRVYETKLGKIGVVIAEDLYFPETVKALSLCGADFIVCPFGKMACSIQTVLLRAYAFCFGVPIFLCAQGYGMVVDAAGEVVFASPQTQSHIDFVNVKEYHLFNVRRRLHKPTS